MDSGDFTAQLAQFSSLEQLTNISEQFETLSTAQADLNNSQAVNYIGRTILAYGTRRSSPTVTWTPCRLHLLIGRMKFS